MGGKNTAKARKELAGHIASLAKLDDYGIPPLSVYQRFNSAGTDVHGQCAIAQGARGYSLTGSIKLNFADMLVPGGPFELTIAGKISLKKMNTTSVMLYRLAELETLSGNRKLPIAVAQMDGGSFSPSLKLSATAGASADLFTLFDASLTADTSVNFGAEFTRLLSMETHHFAFENDGRLADLIDEILAVEIKKTCIQILQAKKTWTTMDTVSVIAEQGKTVFAAADAASGGDIKKGITAVATNAAGQAGAAAKSLAVDKPGWGALIVGAAGAASMLVKKKWNSKKIKDRAEAFLNQTDGHVLFQIEGLETELEKSRDDLIAEIAGETDQSVIATKNRELEKLKEAVRRVSGFKLVMLNESFAEEGDVFLGKMPKTSKAAVSDITLSSSKKDASSLKLNSFNYKVDGSIKGNAKAIPFGKVEADLSAAWLGRIVSFQFQVRGANNVAMMQHTHVNFMTIEAEAALEAQLATSGSDTLDAKALSDLKLEKKKSVQSAGFRRFGALTYRAANVYYGTDTAEEFPNISGITLGVSVRVTLLCRYADAVRTLAKGADLEGKLKQAEGWICKHVGCQPEHLRKFVIDAPLGAMYAPGDVDPAFSKDHNHDAGYPMDALLLEVGYAGLNVVQSQLTPNEMPGDLFKHYGFKSLSSFQAAKHEPSVMRLRYRIHSPFGPKSTALPQLGMDKLGKEEDPETVKKNIGFGLQFGLESEVGQECIVDLHTQFSDLLEQASQEKDAEDNQRYDLSIQKKHELTIPPVVLFNRR